MAACSKVARGVANPAVVPPYQTPSAPSEPFNDVTDNNPCGKNAVATVNGVDVSAQGLCLPHFALKNGLASLVGPIVIS